MEFRSTISSVGLLPNKLSEHHTYWLYLILDVLLAILRLPHNGRSTKLGGVNTTTIAIVMPILGVARSLFHCLHVHLVMLQGYMTPGFQGHHIIFTSLIFNICVPIHVLMCSLL